MGIQGILNNVRVRVSKKTRKKKSLDPLDQAQKNQLNLEKENLDRCFTRLDEIVQVVERDYCSHTIFSSKSHKKSKLE